MLENCGGGEETEEDNDAFMLELFHKRMNLITTIEKQQWLSNSRSSKHLD
jgi:hypothetical protein